MRIKRFHQTAKKLLLRSPQPGRVPEADGVGQGGGGGTNSLARRATYPPPGDTELSASGALPGASLMRTLLALAGSDPNCFPQLFSRLFSRLFSPRQIPLPGLGKCSEGDRLGGFPGRKNPSLSPTHSCCPPWDLVLVLPLVYVSPGVVPPATASNSASDISVVWLVFK